MEKRSVYSILAKKSLKDLVSNIKQFISIIFIIALAVTLFVGLQANYISLDKRVDDFYTQGNVASYFMTYTMVDDNEEKARILFRENNDLKDLLKSHNIPLNGGM